MSWLRLLPVLLALMMTPAGASVKALVLAGNHDALEAALEGGLDPNVRLPDGSLAIAWAAEMQDAAAVELLLSHGARTDDPAAEANRLSPLVAACLNPHERVLNALLNAGADVNARGPDGVPVLAFCAAQAPPQILARMLALGAEVGAAAPNGQTALMWAAAHGREPAFELLLEAGASVHRHSEGGFNALMFAVKSGSATLPLRAIQAGARSDVVLPDGTTLLQLALYQGNFALAEHLVREGADVHAFDLNGHQPLHVAVRAAQPGLARALIEAGAGLNVANERSRMPWRYESNFRAGSYAFPVQTPLLFAAERGDAEMLLLLQTAGADAAARCDAGNNALHWTAVSGRADALRAALEIAPEVNATNARGDTALHRVLLSQEGQVLDEMLRVLAAAGADADVANDAGRTPRQIAYDEAYPGRATFERYFPDAMPRIEVTQR